MKKTLASIALLGASLTMAQVGINTEEPKATLDVVASPDDLTKTDGFIAPRLTGDDLRAKNALYNAPDQTGAVIYVTAADSSPAGKTINVTEEGYYYFDGTAWQKFGSGGAEPWYVQNTTTEAIANTENIYQQGKVAVGFSDTDAVSGKQFEVKGDIKAENSYAGGTVFYGMETGLDIAGLKGTYIYSSNNQNLLSASQLSSMLILHNDASLSVVTPAGTSSVGSNEGKTEMYANNASGDITNRIVAGYDGLDAIDNVMLSSEQGANFSKVIVDKTSGVTFKFNAAPNDKSYTFPKMSGNANQVLRTSGGDNATLSWVDAGTLAPEPWYVSGTTTAATSNTQDIYQSGKVGVGFSNPTYNLEVGDFLSNGSYLSLSQSGANANGQSSLTYFTKRDGNGSITASTSNGWKWFALSDAYTTDPSISNFLFLENWTGGTRTQDVLVAASNGNIGMGIKIPSNKLHIKAASNPLRLEGLQGGAATDNVVTVDATGVLRTMSLSSTSSAAEPWKNQPDATPATSNTANIYQVGNVSIGSQNPIAPFTSNGSTITPKLSVTGDVAATGAFYTSTGKYADYVFEDYFDGASAINKDYKFLSLDETARYIQENKHLPGITSIKDILKTENGYTVNLSELSIQQLEKIEELYLHAIEQQEIINKQRSEIEILNSRVEKLEQLLLKENNK